MQDTTQSIHRATLLKVALGDALAFAGLYLLTAFAHLFALPIYYLDPMRLMLLLGFAITCRKGNAYLLAVTLPLFAFLTTGHPIFPKNLLIIGELSLNIALFSLLLKRFNIPLFGAAFLSILVSKMAYYALKYAFIAWGFLHTSLIDTSLWIQLAMALALALACTLVMRRLDTGC